MQEDCGLVYRWFCTLYMDHSKVESCNIIASFWNILKDSGEENLGRGQNFSNKPDCMFCLEEKIARCVITYIFLGFSS
jgi:hypothetical protein